MRESKIERVLREIVEKLGGRAYKWASPGNAGVPDRIVIFPGRPPVFVETKAPKGKKSTLQNYQHRKLEELGQEVHVIFTMEQLRDFFQAHGFDVGR